MTPSEEREEIALPWGKLQSEGVDGPLTLEISLL